jgi:DNA-binding response OmpR family regulator
MSHRILVADDEKNIATALKFMLERSGFEVLIAENGVAALNAMESDPPDLVLLDVMMPGMNGYEVCQRIRENPRWQATRIVMLTAKGRDVDVEKGLALGADAYVTKPFSTKDLLATVRTMLGAA